MRWALIFAIRFYWWSIPAANRKRCLFKESCSKAVYKESQQSFKFGFKMLLFRYRNCRPGYTIVTHNGQLDLITAKGTRLDQNEINPSIINNHSI